MTVPMITLNDGNRIPQLGFGVWQISQDDIVPAVSKALRVGYRHIDTASIYGNEEGVGEAIRQSGIPREDLFVTTKLWNDSHEPEAARAAMADSLQRLGLDYVDLYLIHWPVPAKGLAGETWRAFEKLYADGAVRAIGVSNFMPEHLDALLEDAEVTPAVNQFECHPSFQQADAQSVSTAAGLVVEAYAPIGKSQDLELPAVRDVAAAVGATPAQAILRWHLQQGRVAIPKSVTPERIRENVDVLGFELSDDQMAAITALDSAKRLFPDPREFTATQFRN